MLNFIGFVLPVFIDLINIRFKDSGTRFLISLIICSLFGIGVSYLKTNGFAGFESIQQVSETMAISAMSMFGMAQLTYKKVWENSEHRVGLGLNAKTL